MKLDKPDTLPPSFWGKFKKEILEWHPLSDHCVDVAACFEALLERTLIRRRLAHLGGLKDLTSVQIERLAVFTALHDMGKFTHGFQRQILENEPRGSHVRSVLYLFQDRSLKKSLFAALEVETLAAWCDSIENALQILLSAISHHGSPVEPSRRVDPASWVPNKGIDPISGLRNLMAKIKKWFPNAFEVHDHDSRLPSLPVFQHAYCGLVTLADWIGSDTRFFPFSSSDDNYDRIVFARGQAVNAIKEMGIDLSQHREILKKRMPDFKETFDHIPRPAQRIIEDICLPSAGSVTVLEAETGSGKTEAALRYFLRLFQIGIVDGMYFALPTRSAATQIHSRIVRAARRIFKEEAPPVILAVPGYIKVDEISGQKNTLAPFSVLWPDANRYRFRGWAAEHPKRYMSGSLIVGTIDQVLLSTLQVSHAHMRSSSLLRHLLVVDEVHASDAYMTVLLCEVLKHHIHAGGHALLMSATLGSVAREQLIPGEHSVMLSLEEAASLPYPAITVKSGSQLADTIAIDKQGIDKNVNVELFPISQDPMAIADLALLKAEKGARILILRNLVDDAIRTQIALEDNKKNDHLLFRCQGIVTLHHGRFAADDRKKLDAALKHRFGGMGVDGGCVIVATQTVEQSLDIDFDLILTDICPMDVLLQRIGRLHRHEHRTRPVGYESPRIMILIPENRDLGMLIIRKGGLRGRARGPHGIGAVYPDLRILETTWRLLENTDILKLPAMNRMLVEKATHPESLKNVVERLGDPWPDHANRMEGIGIGQRGLARLNVIRRDVPFGTVDCLFSGIDDEIRTRLGEDDRIVHFHNPLRSPFGCMLSSLRIPWWMSRADDTEIEASDASEIEGEITFQFGDVIYRYDRFGLRRAHEQFVD